MAQVEIHLALSAAAAEGRQFPPLTGHGRILQAG